MTPEKPRGRVNAPEVGTTSLDSRTIAAFAAIDRAVKTYHRKLAGLDPWTEFTIPEQGELHARQLASPRNEH